MQTRTKVDMYLFRHSWLSLFYSSNVRLKSDLEFSLEFLRKNLLDIRRQLKMCTKLCNTLTVPFYTNFFTYLDVPKRINLSFITFI